MDMTKVELKTVEPITAAHEETAPKRVSWKRPLRTCKPVKSAPWAPPFRTTKTNRTPVEDVEDDTDSDERRRLKGMNQRKK